MDFVFAVICHCGHIPNPSSLNPGCDAGLMPSDGTFAQLWCSSRASISAGKPPAAVQMCSSCRFLSWHWCAGEAGAQLMGSESFVFEASFVGTATPLVSNACSFALGWLLAETKPALPCPLCVPHPNLLPHSPVGSSLSFTPLGFTRCRCGCGAAPCVSLSCCWSCSCRAFQGSVNRRT